MTERPTEAELQQIRERLSAFEDDPNPNAADAVIRKLIHEVDALRLCTEQMVLIDVAQGSLESERELRLEDMQAVLNALPLPQAGVLVNPEFGPQSKAETPIYLREEVIARIRALTARAEAAERQVDRLIHGQEIESDKLCDHELHVRGEMQKRVDDLTAERDATLKAYVQVWQLAAEVCPGDRNTSEWLFCEQPDVVWNLLHSLGIAPKTQRGDAKAGPRPTAEEAPARDAALRLAHARLIAWSMYISHGGSWLGSPTEVKDDSNLALRAAHQVYAMIGKTVDPMDVELAEAVPAGRLMGAEWWARRVLAMKSAQ